MLNRVMIRATVAGVKQTTLVLLPCELAEVRPATQFVLYPVEKSLEVIDGHRLDLNRSVEAHTEFRNQLGVYPCEDFELDILIVRRASTSSFSLVSNS